MKWVVVVACVLGLSSVALGAAGDHMLAGMLADEGGARFAVALRYHQLYSIVLLVLGLYAAGCRDSAGKILGLACAAFLAGVLVFCGSLYAAALLNQPVFTYGTPFGGILLMAGWVFTGYFALRLR